MNSKNLVMLRNKKDLTQREMAKIIKVSKSTYARWENQEEIILLWHLLTFCNYFKVSMNYVLGLSDKNDYYKYDYTKKLDKEKIGNYIKSLRKKNKLTQKELASILNTSQSTICDYENGKTLLLTAFAYNIAKEFNISIDKLCDRVKEKKVTKV